MRQIWPVSLPALRLAGAVDDRPKIRPLITVGPEDVTPSSLAIVAPRLVADDGDKAARRNANFLGSRR